MRPKTEPSRRAGYWLYSAAGMLVVIAYGLSLQVYYRVLCADPECFHRNTWYSILFAAGGLAGEMMLKRYRNWAMPESVRIPLITLLFLCTLSVLGLSVGGFFRGEFLWLYGVMAGLLAGQIVGWLHLKS